MLTGVRITRSLYSIIIGGNKLSRGLTLEGLCISCFCRSSETIAEIQRYKENDGLVIVAVI